MGHKVMEPPSGGLHFIQSSEVAKILWISIYTNIKIPDRILKGANADTA